MALLYFLSQAPPSPEMLKLVDPSLAMTCTFRGKQPSKRACSRNPISVQYSSSAKEVIDDDNDGCIEEVQPLIKSLINHTYSP